MNHGKQYLAPVYPDRAATQEEVDDAIQIEASPVLRRQRDRIERVFMAMLEGIEKNKEITVCEWLREVADVDMWPDPYGDEAFEKEHGV